MGISIQFAHGVIVWLIGSIYASAINVDSDSGGTSSVLHVPFMRRIVICGIRVEGELFEVSIS
jgi:hypothetical protein